MENNLLIKLCIISAIVGIILLIIVSDKISIQTSTISSIDKSDINSLVKIRGTVKSAINKNTVSFLEIMDKTGKIKVVAFKPTNLTIKKDSMIEIEGKVSFYENNIQLYAETIKILN